MKSRIRATIPAIFVEASRRIWSLNLHTGGLLTAITTEQLWDDLMDGLVRGRYSLLLGAGASIGAHNGRNQPLLSAVELREWLAHEYGMPTTGLGSLRQVYDLATLMANKTGEAKPSTKLRGIYSECSVPDWYGELVRVPWRVIWTLNIDDVLERAYWSVHNSRAHQDLKSRSWSERWVSLRQMPSEVLAVHLHGTAKRADLIFGTLDYLAAANDGGAAHRIFWDEWLGSEPIIALGASLDDEIDMAMPLGTGRSTIQEYPSVMVRPFFDDFDQFRVEALGLRPIPLSAEAFFREVRQRWQSAARKVSLTAPPETIGISPLQLAFLRQFTSSRTKPDRRHDFFAGDEPLLADIYASFDAARVLPDLSINSETVFPEAGLRAIVFHGELSGTTTAELRFLKGLEDAGVEFLEHRGDSAFDPEAVHRMATMGMRKVLRIPDLDEFPEQVRRLRLLTEDSGTPLVIVTSVRSSRLHVLRPQLGDALLSVHVSGTLRDSEIEALLQTLKANNRENRLAGMSTSEKRQLIVQEHRRNLLDSLAAISRGRAFSDRYLEALSEVRDAEAATVLGLSLISGELGFDLPEGVAARAAHLPISRVREIADGNELGRLVVRSVSGIGPRHKGLAARASTAHLDGDRRFRLSRDLAIALSTYITPSAITARTREARLVARLMDASRVVGALGAARADEWYSSLEDHFGWNSRFWEQRALAEISCSVPRYERAESWARQGVAKHSDPFSLNTLATVLLRRATSGSGLDEDLFFEGLRAADDARRELRGRDSEHPFVTALHYLALGKRKARGDTDLSRRIDVFFNQWHRAARESELWTIPEYRRDLSNLVGRYLKER